MKIRIAVLALAAVFPLVILHAAETRVFEGVNLDELRQVQQLKVMPEIYERDPANRRFRLPKAVVQIPLGAAWVSFNAARSAFYLNKVPGENAAAYFGPIPGDAFKIFKLEEKFITTLRKDSARSLMLGIVSRTDRVNGWGGNFMEVAKALKRLFTGASEGGNRVETVSIVNGCE